MQKPVVATTQDHLDIEDIRDDLVITRGGGAALILQTTAVNFGLLSEAEQDATIFAYAGLLNSLSFPIQIVIRSKKMDISSYLELLDAAAAKQANPLLKGQIIKYKNFIESTIKENRVLDKRFYITIPFAAIELGAKSTFNLGSIPIQSGSNKKLPYNKNYILDRAKTALYPKRDHLIKQLARIGLKAQQLATQELVELFYDIYNPATIGMQKLTAAAQEYATPLVAPAIETAMLPAARPAFGATTPLQAVSTQAQISLSQKIASATNVPKVPTGAVTPQAQEATQRVESSSSQMASKTGQALKELQQSVAAARAQLSQQSGGQK